MRLRRQILENKIEIGEIMELQKFYETSDVYITHDEAWQILVCFLGGNADSKLSSLTFNNRSFAQALLFEAIRASLLISGIEKFRTKNFEEFSHFRIFRVRK